MLAVLLDTVSIRLYLLVTEEKVNEGSITEQNNVTLDSENSFSVSGWLNKQRKAVQMYNRWIIISVWDDNLNISYPCVSTDIVFSILYTRRDLHFRVLARSQRSLETSTVHIYKCTPEEIPSLFAAPVFPATSDVEHRHTEFDCHSRRNRRFSPNYEPLCPSCTHLSLHPR